MASMEQPRGFDENEHFYEDDEPLGKITAAFEQGEHGVTAPLVGVDTHGLTPERHTATQPGIVTLIPVAVEPVRPVAVCR